MTTIVSNNLDNIPGLIVPTSSLQWEEVALRHIKAVRLLKTEQEN